MFFKEKIVKRKLFKNEVKLTKQDKDDILNKIIDKTDLEVSEKVSFRKKVNLKVVYALACSLVICVLGYVGYLFANDYLFVDPNYRGKQIELLNLDEDDICIGFSNKFTSLEKDHIDNKYNLSVFYSKDCNKYLVFKDCCYLYLANGKEIYEYKINIKSNPEEIINMYNDKFQSNINYEDLNSNKTGLLFSIKENGIEFYTRDNNKKYPIFVEFE